jgi:phage shock protein C
MIDNILLFFEKQAFGVCEYLGEKWGMNSGRIRLYFIYLSFITFGSPLVLYLFLAFWLEQKEQFRKSNRSIWEL